MCQGASKINSVVNQYFGAMVACIEAHGGDVIKFAGDALIVEWAAARHGDMGGGSLGRSGGGGGGGAGLSDSNTSGPAPKVGVGEGASDQHVALAASAARCALALAELAPPRPPGMTGEMSLHTALAFGMVAAMHVGGVAQRYEFFITGHHVRPLPFF